MSTLLALRCLRNSLKCSSALQYCINPLKYQKNLMPATQDYATKMEASIANSTELSNDEWRTIYHLPLIRLASAFNRLKVPYGILNTAIIPVVFALEQSAQIPAPTAILVTTVGLTSWCTLAISSLFVRNLIGFVYINDNNDKLKLAYVDYWGKRNDVCVDLDDVIPENGKSKPSKLDFYQSLCLYSDKTVKYKLLTRFGRIDDLETFIAIFGE